MLFKNFQGREVTVSTDDSRDDLITPFGKQTLEDRYNLPGETYQGMFARVSAAYSDDTDMAQRIYDYMSRQWFMPSTPILSNGGTDRGNPISCFLNSVPDSMAGIRDVWSENVGLASQGGGIGTYWGNVRSIGERVGAVGKTSGIIPFIHVQDSLTLAISQGSLRRGSAAVYLDINHPEIVEFLEIRKPTGDPNRRSLNLHHGVNISDAFMDAMLKGESWDLISPHDGSVQQTVQARDLWQRLLTMRVETGEPYLIFSDTVDRMRPEVYKRHGLKVRQSNLCSEIALATGFDYLGNDRTAVCCLASVNYMTMDEWYGNVQFLRDCLVFLDNVLQSFIDRTDGMPGFEKARYSAMMERSIGLGKMGFHSYLQSKGIPFESAMAKAINLRLHKWLKVNGDVINMNVAASRGACPDGVSLGIRWSHMFATAPTASISIICGGVSACDEPWASNLFTQKTLSGSFEVRNQALDRVIRTFAEEYPEGETFDPQKFIDDAWQVVKDDEGSVMGLSFLTQDEKDVFKTAFEVDQRWIIEHAAARAPYIDQMASNNLFIRADAWKEDIHNLHVKAWREGVPSLYYCRSKALQRGTKVKNLAGEMPQASDAPNVVLAWAPLEADAYEECLACT